MEYIKNESTIIRCYSTPFSLPLFILEKGIKYRILSIRFKVLRQWQFLI